MTHLQMTIDRMAKNTLTVIRQERTIRKILISLLITVLIASSVITLYLIQRRLETNRRIIRNFGSGNNGDCWTMTDRRTPTTDI